MKLVIPIRNRIIEIDVEGNVLPGDFVKEVRYFTIEKDGYYGNSKKYFNFKDVFKAVIHKVQANPYTNYQIYMNFNGLYSTDTTTFTTTKLFSLDFNLRGNLIEIYTSYEAYEYCEINLDTLEVEFYDEVSAGEEVIQKWMPRKRNRKPTEIQQKVKSFEAYNVKNIDFKGKLKPDEKNRFLQELNESYEQLAQVFDVNDYYPVEEIYFSKYATAKGKWHYLYGKISFDKKAWKNIHDTFYHEYGHLLYDYGQCGKPSLTNNMNREKATAIMDKIISILHDGKRLKNISNQAIIRMENRGIKPSSIEDIEANRTDFEKYLLKESEIFARLFESYMLSLDQSKGKNLKQKLFFSLEEIESVKSYLMEYLNQIHLDYQFEKSTNKS